MKSVHVYFTLDFAYFFNMFWVRKGEIGYSLQKCTHTVYTRLLQN